MGSNQIQNKAGLELNPCSNNAKRTVASPSPANIERWEGSKEEHDQIYECISKGAIIRSRVTMVRKR